MATSKDKVIDLEKLRLRKKTIEAVIRDADEVSLKRLMKMNLDEIPF